jgi:hypothetical protein
MNTIKSVTIEIAMFVISTLKSASETTTKIPAIRKRPVVPGPTGHERREVREEPVDATSLPALRHHGHPGS